MNEQGRSPRAQQWKRNDVILKAQPQIRGFQCLCSRISSCRKHPRQTPSRVTTAHRRNSISIYCLTQRLVASVVQDRYRDQRTTTEVEQPRGSRRFGCWTGEQPGCVGASCSGPSHPQPGAVEQVGCAAGKTHARPLTLGLIRRLESRRAQEEVRGAEQVVAHALAGY